MKTGLLFAGQGQQFLLMGQDLCDAYSIVQDIYEQANDRLGYDIRCLDMNQLQMTRYTQPALYVLGHALDTLLKTHYGIKPDCVAGLSLGEYNALVSAGVLSFQDGLKLICQRAEIMHTAFEPYTTSMAACLRTSYEAVESLLAGTDVEICNVNTPSQIVIGGSKSSMDALLPVFKASKILVIPLKVSTVSHMSLLKPASNALREVLESFEFSKPAIPFINNLYGAYQSDNFADTLSRHISEPTQMAKTIQLMHDAGIERFIEVGPKGSLLKFVKEICGNDAVVSNVYDLETLEEMVR